MKHDPNCETHTTRVRYAAVSARTLLDIIKDGGHFTIDSEVPPTATIRAAYFDRKTFRFLLLIEDDSFEPIAEGGLIPTMLDIRLTNLTTDPK